MATDKRTQSGKEEEIYLVVETGFLSPGSDIEAFSTEEAADARFKDGMEIYQINLHRPDLRPIYGGPTLLEALWSEMDRLMEGLMTGADAEDGGDRYRAAELAWVLAIVANPYSPSVDAIRAEAVARWNAAEAEAAAQETALDPDPDAHEEGQCIGCVGLEHRPECPEWEMPV